MSGFRLHFKAMPSRAYSNVDLEAPEAVLELPDYVWELSDLVGRGAEIVISGTNWRLSRTHLSLLSDAIARFRGKIKKGNFAKGTKREALSKFLPILKRVGLVVEDASRPGHQLELTAKAHELLGRLRSHPLETQDEVVRLFDEKSSVRQDEVAANGVVQHSPVHRHGTMPVGRNRKRKKRKGRH